MTRTQAYRVLGLTEDADRAEIKSRYRQLMHKLHPDSRSEEKENYPYSAREINEAYGILVKGKGAKDSFIRRTKESTTSKAEWEAKRQHRQKKNWNAPENPHAYCIRNIYQYVEDADGAVIGEFVITEGKYLWTIEEDFPLFLRVFCLQQPAAAGDRSEIGKKCERRGAAKGTGGTYLSLGTTVH